MSTFTSLLEGFLHHGDIHIGPKGEFFLLAVYTPHGQSPTVVVETQRGIHYLLLLLEANLTKKDERAKEIMEEADRKYPYSIAIAGITELDRFFEKTTVHLYRDKSNMIGCEAFQIHTPMPMKKEDRKVPPIPGVYTVEAFEYTILEAFVSCQNGSFTRIKELLSV